MKISYKIFGIALVVLSLMLVVAVYSIRMMSTISDELDLVVGTQFPISEAITRINVRTLEQGVLLQRLFVLEGDSELKASFDNDQARYGTLSKKIISEFEGTRRLIEVERKVSTEIKQSVDVLRQDMEVIKREYESFLEHGEKLMLARKANNLDQFNTLLPDLNKRQDTVNLAISNLRRHVEQQTNDAIRRADKSEKMLLMANTALTTLAAILGLGFAFLVTRKLVITVRNLVSGTEAIEAGELDTKVAITSRDEIGRLTNSFNHMVGELRLKERIKDTFGKYMDPRIVNKLLDHPSFVEPGGERCEMTVMFIDLKGFTSISEKLPPDQLVHMVNAFFGYMTEAISKNSGVVDKFMGDAVMAFWGPPFTQRDEHAELACRAAVEALDNLVLFRKDMMQKLSSDGDDLEIDLRIGISTGEMIVGTIGSAAARSFTVMGDPVNLGSRLEGANKNYGTRIIISERTRELTGATAIARELDLVRVKGKLEPTRIYQLINMATNNKLLNNSGEETFQLGLDAYRRQDWESARRTFQHCLEEHPDDSVSAIYLERVNQLSATPPPSNWDGVWVFDSK